MSLALDIRHAFRQLRRSPGFTAIALTSIVITVGAVCVVFTAVEAVLLKPLPYWDADNLFFIRTDSSLYPASHADWVFWPDMQDVARRTRTLESPGLYQYAIFNLIGDRNLPPEALYGAYVSASLFPTLGVKPMLGRNVLPEEEQLGPDREMILSFGLWKRRFNSDPNIVGRSVEVNGHPCVIIGVMPPAFDFPMRLATTVQVPAGHMDFWAPQAVDPAKVDRNSPGFGAVARLRKDVSPIAAQQDLLSIAAALEHEYPRTNEGRSLHLISLPDRTFGSARTGLLLLLAAASVFLLIGCANVANLLLARNLARRNEISVRMAVGATPGHIVRQFITEKCLLALIGGVGAYILTTLAWKLLPAVVPLSIPRLASARADGIVFFFALSAAVLSALVFGIGPALWMAGRHPAAGLSESAGRGSIGTSHKHARSTLVIAEVAIAVALVVIGGVLAGSFVKLIRTDPGFDANRVLASIVIASGDQYPTPESREPLFRRIVDRVRSLPGIESAGTVDALPFTGENHGGDIGATLDSSARRRGAQQIAEIDRVSSQYLETMGVRLIEGRWFREDDLVASRDTALINEVAAKQLWPGQDPLEKRFCVSCLDEKYRQWKQVVGVVTSIRHSGLDEPGAAQIYYAGGAYRWAQFLVARITRPAPELAKAIRGAIASIDPKQPVFLSATMSTLIADSVADRRFIVTLLATTGCLALLLAAAGVYGVMSYTASRRTREIGIRMALGALPRHIHALIFRQGMLLAASGAAVGLVVVVVSLQVLRNRISGIAGEDTGLILIAVGLVVTTGLIACWIPAHRAARIDPMEALRKE